MLRPILVLAVIATGLSACASYPPRGPQAPSAPSRSRVTPPPPPIDVIRPRIP